jgi:flagellar hook assembly protein FlgD
LTNIKLLNPSAGVYKIIIYNVFGEKIRSLELEGTSNNISEIQWDGKNDRLEQVSSGIYLITAEIKTDLKSINFSSSKVIYLK